MASGNNKICVSSCDPRVGHYQCPENAGCVPNDTADLSQGGRCMPGAIGPGALGDACSSGADCKDGICLDAKCSVWCNQDGTCPTSGYTCDTSSAPSPGVCKASSSGVTPFKCNCAESSTGLPGAGLLAAALLALIRRRRV